jgi:hypothetical protein
MKANILSVGLLAVCSLVACEKKSPTAPDTGGVTPSAASADARSGVTQAAPQPVSPADNANIAYAKQPITFTVANGLNTVAGKNLTYTFEIATDASFTTIVSGQSEVAEGSNNRTSVSIPALGADATYYWRARTVVNGIGGPNSKPRSFRIGPVVLIQAPVNNQPQNGSTTGIPVALSVNAAQRQGPAGPLQYEFELSLSPSFNTIVHQQIVPEQGNVTFANISNVNQGVTYYWHARAIDQLNELTTGWSNTREFTPQSFDPRTAVFHDNPPDIGHWPQGARITSIVFTPHAIEVDFDRRSGPNRWPDVTPPGWSGSLQYTLGMCMNVNGKWNCSAVVQFWHERSLSDSGPPSDIAFEWFYDGGRWKDLHLRQPADGETVALFVVSGDARQQFFTQASCPRVCERSDFVLVPFSRYGGVSSP